MIQREYDYRKSVMFDWFAPRLLAILSISGIVIAGFSATALATSAAPSAIASMPADCALHIWPAETAHSTYMGWWHGGATDGDRRGIKGYPHIHAEALGLPEQVRLLRTIDWAGETGQRADLVTVHDSPSPSDDDRTRTSRLVPGAGCYREIIVTSAIIEAAAMSNQSVRIVALRKSFDASGAVPVNFSSMTSVKVEMPDKKDPAFDEKVVAAMQAGYLAAVRKFIVLQSFH